MKDRRKTKVICTIGPSTKRKDDIVCLVENGMNIARINFSHGNHKEHHNLIINIREAAASLGKTVPIIGDLCGPKIRIGKLDNEVLLKEDDHVVLVSGLNRVSFDYQSLSVNYDKLNQDVNAGDSVLIDDGLIDLIIVDKNESGILCKVIEGGTVRSNKGVNFPDSILSVPSLTDKDKKDLDFAIENKLDYIALSFVRNSEDIIELRQYMAEKDYNAPIIAKIEKPQAIEDIDRIIEKSEIIMIARGDLGVEMNAYEVPILQKEIIRKCLVYNKPVITATQMLESMINHPRCTRAEASDVANAVFDGTDTVMLSGETSIGSYPITAVKIMHSILLRAENTDYLRLNLLDDQTIIVNTQLAIDLSKAACRIAQDIKAAIIIAMTKTGRTARFLSKYRTKTPILAFTPNKTTMPILCMTWGVEGVLIDSFDVTDKILSQAKAYALGKKLINKEELIVFVTGSPILVTNEINMIKIEKA